MNFSSLFTMLFSMHCSLSISFTSSHTQSCSAQIISNNQLLTAAHCLIDESSSLKSKDALIIATCGNPNFIDKIFYIDSFLPYNTPEHISTSNDKAILSFSDQLDPIQKDIPSISKYKSLYFGVDGRLKKGTECFSIGLDFRVIHFNDSQLRFNKIENSIESKTLETFSEHPTHTLIPGDSGSPLYCKPSYKNAVFELIAVTSKVKTSKENPTLLFGNKFTPLF